MQNKSVKADSSSQTTHKGIGRKLAAAGWGLFFIWVGSALLMDLSWGIGLIGVAAVIYLGQAARKLFGRRLEAFWVVVGGLFLLGGIWELYPIDVDIVPVLMIVAGFALVLSLFRRNRRTNWWRGWCFEDAADRSSERRPWIESRRSGDCCGWRR